MLYFRFPFSDSFFSVDENSNEKKVSFISFDEADELGFKGNITEISHDELLEQPYFSHNLSSELLNFNEESQSEYQQKLENVIEFIKESRLAKLVISRRKLLNFNDDKVNLKETFLNLCSSYPNAFVYFFVKENTCWIGAFSELLGKFNKKTSEFETMSLAGTLPLNEDWSNKEIEEQKPVTGFIKNILEKYSVEVEQSQTHDHITGNIKHLRTDFKAKIKPKDLENLIAELHPTPAVCGIPKDLCRNAIQNFESHPRKLYAGYIRAETDESVQYFVNLRCAEIYKNAALSYVGGGITAISSPEKEWRETELKAEAVLKNLAFVKKECSNS